MLGVTRQTDFRRVTRQIDCGRGQETDRLWPGSQDRLIDKKYCGRTTRQTDKQADSVRCHKTDKQADRLLGNFVTFDLIGCD